jgi:CRISPR-associated protein Csm4
MKTYLIELSVPSGFVTPWHADTLFGHLCWAAERGHGFENFKGAAGFIDLYRRGSPPVILSDGFPGDLLPAPVNLRNLFLPEDSAKLDMAGYASLKRIKKAEYLTREQFSNYQRGEFFDFAPIKNKPIVKQPALHNQISRLTNKTGDSGSLFELEEQYVSQGVISVYAKVEEGMEKDVRDLFEQVAASGFGAKKSTGKGAFTVRGFEPFAGFDLSLLEGTAPNGFISLSHVVPAKDDPVNGAYRTTVKYGKLGEEKTFCGNPFKKPLVMLKPGAVFRAENVRPWYGRLLEGIAYADPNVVQYGYAFAVPVMIRD